MERCSIFSSWNGIRASFCNFLSPKSRRRFSKRSFWLLSRIGIHGPIGSKILKNFVGPVRFHGQTDFGSWIPDQGLTLEFARAVVSSLHLESITFLKRIPFKSWIFSSKKIFFIYHLSVPNDSGPHFCNSWHTICKTNEKSVQS